VRGETKEDRDREEKKLDNSKKHPALGDQPRQAKKIEKVNRRLRQRPRTQEKDPNEREKQLVWGTAHGPKTQPKTEAADRNDQRMSCFNAVAVVGAGGAAGEKRMKVRKPTFVACFEVWKGGVRRRIKARPESNRQGYGGAGEEGRTPAKRSFETGGPKDPGPGKVHPPVNKRQKEGSRRLTSPLGKAWLTRSQRVATIGPTTQCERKSLSGGASQMGAQKKKTKASDFYG